VTSRIAFIGNSLPRRCGIATFTTDLQQAVSKSEAGVETAIVAMTDGGHAYDYPPVVRLQVDDGALAEYEHAAHFLNDGHFDAVCLQHEFGIFGGDAGIYITALLSQLSMPIITTLHTVLAEPTKVQRNVLDKIIAASSTVIVMAEQARVLLDSVYEAPADKIEVIPHGIPNSAFVEPDAAKEKLGFRGKSVILTFGLLSPNKGIEVMIDAMPLILSRKPDAVYVVLGATHPNLIRQEGESYRHRLVARARTLGVQDHVVFMDRFVDQPTLLDFISMCDVYVTPYLNEAQMTSGTLAYSFGLGKAVVSTPYWHARELLAGGRGILVPFGNCAAIGCEIAGLLTDDDRRLAMRIEAYSSSRSMTWERTARRYEAAFERARQAHPQQAIARRNQSVLLPDLSNAPPVKLSHFLSMCDDTGLLQHAVCCVPDREHGYCIDDNARALLVACALNGPGEERLPDALISRLAAFVQHAWNPVPGRFRNFMSFDRRWLEDIGSEDSHGRTLWALGECTRNDAKESRRQWAATLFASALPTAERFSSPRAWAFTLLGLDAFAKAGDDSRIEDSRRLLADRLVSHLSAIGTNDWLWFEDVLAYDNARLPQALIVTGTSLRDSGYLAAGLSSLRWLMTQQTSAEGVFRPVGCQSFGEKRTKPRAFDQQPLEAAATISACIAAWRADGYDNRWKDDAARAFTWFHGNNDLLTPLVDLETGSCRDGLHPGRANENRGAESVVSYLLGQIEIRRFIRVLANRNRLVQQRPLRAPGVLHAVLSTSESLLYP